mmetsp:Transcript_20141/g.58448  ORF Transcript_20141/g.58448 Transcript_20141/m.58448 type:complete len:87 (-) Transcript_20141:126-386(-)
MVAREVEDAWSEESEAPAQNGAAWGCAAPECLDGAGPSSIERHRHPGVGAGAALRRPRREVGRRPGNPLHIGCGAHRSLDAPGRLR